MDGLHLKRGKQNLEESKQQWNNFSAQLHNVRIILVKIKFISH